MTTAASVLLLDDLELKRFRSALIHLGADLVHLYGEQIQPGLQRPRDLLVTTWRQALKLPRFGTCEESSEGPIWICAHNQDFLPLRQRMRGLGVHFLVHSLIDSQSLELLLGQLLYRGAEKRGALRLPMGWEITYYNGSVCRTGALAEISAIGCQIISSEDLPTDTLVTLHLRPDPLQEAQVRLQARTVRSLPCYREPEPPIFSVMLAFEPLGTEARSLLDRILGGGHPGICVTPLEPASQLPAGEQGREERRGVPRHAYSRGLTAFTAMGTTPQQVVLGRDLSVDGMSIERAPGLTIGCRIGLALHDGVDETPVLVDAIVVNEDDERRLGLRFVSLSPEQRWRLERIVGQLARIESISSDDPQGEALVVSRLLRSAGADAPRE